MFDALLRSKFYSKCKSEIKLTRKRIEIIKRKRNAMQKFLRNDVADLLKKGLDSNAYSRVEQLYVDQNLSSCYEFIEQSCLLILTHLSAMDKQRECPEECKEAISTLMYAAARFADLPELRELRSLFAERYGNCLEPYVNKEFVKNLKADTPTEEIKHLMLLDIKLEYDLEWDDNKALEQKLYKPPQFVQDSSQDSHKPQHQDTVFKEAQVKKSEVAKKKENDLAYKTWGELAERKTEKQNNKNNKQQTMGKSLGYKSRGNEVEKKQDGGEGRYWSSTSSCSSDTTTTHDDSSSSASEDALEGRKYYLKPDSKCKANNINSLRAVGPPYIKTDLTNSTNVTTPAKQVPRSMRIRRPFKPVSGSHGHNEISKQSPVVVVVSGDRDFEQEGENKRKLACAPTRITSLPVESLVVTEEEGKKGFVRAVTDLSRGHHVHPKLPEYDDFVARLAAFRAPS